MLTDAPGTGMGVGQKRRSRPRVRDSFNLLQQDTQ